jgi:hypothetical protein
MSMQPLEPVIRQPDTEEQEWSPDTHWRATITKSHTGRLWREPSTDVTLDEVRTRTFLATGHRVSAQGVEEPLSASEMQQLQSALLIAREKNAGNNLRAIPQ